MSPFVRLSLTLPDVPSRVFRLPPSALPRRVLLTPLLSKCCALLSFGHCVDACNWNSYEVTMVYGDRSQGDRCCIAIIVVVVIVIAGIVVAVIECQA